MSLALTTVLEIAEAVIVSVANIRGESVTTATPTLTLNGYSLVPSSPETVTSIYGQWTYLPGGPTLVQGEQQFDVVGSATSTPVGTFTALVGSATAFDYTVLLVTANDGANVGTGAGQVPPVGSLIATFNLGLGFGWTYSSLASESGDVVSFALRTPFGDLALPLSFDAAAGIADHTVDNQPIDLANGYSIAPADPTGETITGMSGLLPLFTAVQAVQTFNIYDADGNVVGSFEGQSTTTADILGTHTEALLVVANDGTNVGTAAGQVPPVGTVYNVIYTSETDSTYGVYTSMPSPSGDVVTVIQVDSGAVTTSAVTFIDASAPASTKPLSSPSGGSFVPVSALQPSGINGLPPREVQIQGYQQFDVYDASGARTGSFDADVTEQWDLLGIRSTVVLVTKVTDGVEGTAAGDVAPAGSVFNYTFLGDTGFGVGQSVIPTAAGDVSTLKLITPFGDIVLFSTTIAVTDRADVSYYDPFETV